MSEIRPSGSEIEYKTWCPDCKGKGLTSFVKIYWINDFETYFRCSNTQCVWPLATHTVEQIYGIHDPQPKKADNKKVYDKKENPDHLSPEPKQVENQKVLKETLLEEKTANNDDVDDSEEYMNFKFNVRAPLSPMPASPQQEADNWEQVLSEEDGKIS